MDLIVSRPDELFGMVPLAEVPFAAAIVQVVRPNPPTCSNLSLISVRSHCWDPVMDEAQNPSNRRLWMKVVNFRSGLRTRVLSRSRG